MGPRSGPLDKPWVFSDFVDGAHADRCSDASGMRNVTVSVETDGHVDADAERVRVLSGRSISDATPDAQPVPVDTSTCDALRRMDPKRPRGPSHPTRVVRSGLNPSSQREGFRRGDAFSGRVWSGCATGHNLSRFPYSAGSASESDQDLGEGIGRVLVAYPNLYEQRQARLDGNRTSFAR
jgi:hypothetical protein